MTDLPACFSATAEAMEAYLVEKDNGFDGSLNDFLDMERHRICKDDAVNNMDAGALKLWQLGEWAELRRRAVYWLNKAS